MKKYTAGLFAVGAVMLSGLMFIGFGGMAYTSMGTQGELSPANISISLLFCICLLFASIFCGYKKMSGVLLGIGVVAISFIATGFLCYFGYSSIVGRFVAVFYIISAPFVPLIESITDALNLYSRADLTMILIPSVFFVSSIAVYFVGKNLSSRTSLTLRSGSASVNNQHGEQLTA